RVHPGRPQARPGVRWDAPTFTHWRRMATHWRRTGRRSIGMARGIRVGVVVAAAVGAVSLTVGFAAGQAKGGAKAGEAGDKAKGATCHGAAGNGDTPAGKALNPKPRDWTEGEGLDLTDQQLFDSIKKGGAAVGRGKTMIAFPSLSDTEVWNLVAYVRSLKKA